MSSEQEIITSQQLREIRQQLGLTQRELADLLGMDNTAFSHMEAGRRNITARTQLQLRQLLANRKK